MTKKRLSSTRGDPLRRWAIVGVSLLIIGSLVGCSQGIAAGVSPTGGTQVPELTATPEYCANPLKVVDLFYAANDASRFDESLTYLTDDVALVSWAEGANGHHMVANFAVGKEQIQDFLSKPGLTMASHASYPSFSRKEVTQSGNKLTFKLVADHNHPDGRPYNSYVVEMIFSGCKIEIIKVVERVGWL